MIKSFIFSFIALLVIDSVWLGMIAKKFYLKELGSIARKSGESLSPFWPAAIGTYILIALGLAFFVIPKAHGNAMSGLLLGGFMGLIIYGVYDLTNLATLKDFTLKMAVVDIFWGVTLCALTSFLVLTLEKVPK